ncbi:UNVERIFIED_ORG: hypothetical protein GGE11_005031 [Mycolicibacterium obuense]
MTATLGPMLVDAADPPAMAAFWSAALGRPEQERLLRFRVQRAPKTVKNRVHLDVAVGPEGRGVDRLLRLGARVLADHLPDWVTLADVEGNEFCAFPGRPDDDAAARVFAVCTDSAQPEQLAESVDDLVAAGALMRSDGTLVDPQGNEFSADPESPAG